MSTGHRFARHSTAEIQQGLSAQPSLHPPRILVLYGSLRPESYSRKAAHQAVAILEEFGAEVRVFDPAGLPIFDYESVDHPKVQELRGHVRWAEGMVWCSPEIHGTVSAAFKNQIDWIPLTEGSIRPTQGKTLAVMQVTGGSQSFNVVNTLRVLGRWMRMLTIPNQSSIPKAWQEFDQDGAMKPSSYRDRVVDVMEELVKFTILTRDRTDYLVDRFSESQDSPPLPPAVPVNKEMALPLPQAPTRACCT